MRKIVTCSNEGCGKCESSGVESDGIHLSKDVAFFFHTLGNIDNHLDIPAVMEFGNVDPGLQSLPQSKVGFADPDRSQAKVLE